MSDPGRPVASSDVPWTEITNERQCRFRVRRLAVAAGASELGCSELEVPPGHSAWPYHYHHGNEEAIYVLEGTGTLRTPSGEHALEPGSYAAFPRGERGAHRILNTSDAPLRYLCFSTMREPDISVMPDSGKVGLFAGSAPGGPKETRTLSRFVRAEDAEYFDDEP